MNFEKKSTENIIFIITKPLQLLIATAISKQIKGDITFSLFVVDGFSDSKLIAGRLLEANLGWDVVRWFPSKKIALIKASIIKPDNVFVDSDVGTINSISLTRAKLLSPRTKFFVYEEGIGSYRTDLYAGLKKKILDFVGVATSFGQSPVVSGIWLYEPNRYRNSHPNYRKECVTIETSIHSLLEDEFSNIFQVFDYEVSGDSSKLKEKKCNIYFSSWQVDSKFMESFSALPEMNYIKLHPHIKNSNKTFMDCGLSVFPARLPAEIVIMLLCKLYEEVTVYHHGSSIEKYMPVIQKVNYINLGFYKAK